MIDEDPPAFVAATPPRRSAAWIRTHLDAVYRYAHRLLGPAPASRDDAEDVAQQVFLALFEAEAAGRAPDDAGAWLIGAARRRVMDVRRRHARGLVPTRLPDGWEGYAEGPLPDEVLHAEEVRELVAVALGLLSVPDRSLLEARYRQGLSLADIARGVRASEKAVENRLRRARQRFAEHYLSVGRDWARAGEEAT